MLGRVRYSIQLFINVNKGVFGLIISCLPIKSYNVFNFNNFSTDWSFPLYVGGRDVICFVIDVLSIGVNLVIILYCICSTVLDDTLCHNIS
jgi:hypothetical protein